MPGGLVLAGGEEFRPNCEVMDEFILEATGVKPAKVFILPTAAVTGPQKAAHRPTEGGIRRSQILLEPGSECIPAYGA